MAAKNSCLSTTLIAKESYTAEDVTVERPFCFFFSFLLLLLSGG